MLQPLFYKCYDKIVIKMSEDDREKVITSGLP